MSKVKSNIKASENVKNITVDNKIDYNTFADIKGLKQTIRFILSKKYTTKSYTYTQWEEIISKEKL